MIKKRLSYGHGHGYLVHLCTQFSRPLPISADGAQMSCRPYCLIRVDQIVCTHYCMMTVVIATKNHIAVFFLLSESVP